MVTWDKEKNGDGNKYVIAIGVGEDIKFYQGLIAIKKPRLTKDINKALHMPYGEAFGKAKNLTGRAGYNPTIIEYCLDTADEFGVKESA